MKKILMIILICGFLILPGVVLGVTYTGDGTYTAKEGDTIVADNGQSIKLGQISWALQGDTIPKILLTYSNGGSTSVHENDATKLGYGPYDDKYLNVEIVSINKNDLTAQITIQSIKELGERPPNVILPGENISVVPKIRDFVTYPIEGSYKLKPLDEVKLRDGYTLKYVTFQKDAKVGTRDGQIDTSTALIALFPPNVEANESVSDKAIYSFSIDSVGTSGIFTTVSEGFTFRLNGLNPTTEEVSIEVFSGMTVNLKQGWNLISPSYTAITCDIGKCYGEGNNKINVRENNCKDLNELTFWKYNSLTNDYVKSIPVPPLGYWVKSDRDCSMVFAGQPVSITNQKLYKGWNIIGGPSNSNNAWNITVNKGDCVITKGPWRYTGSWEKTSTMYALTGHFIKVENDCTLGGN